MGKIKVGIVGIGNCASSLIQGLEYYRDVDKNSGFVPGIIHNTLKKYRIRDIQIVAAFDVNNFKVGIDLSDAINSHPNCAYKFCEVPFLNVEVIRGPLLDGLSEKLQEIIPVDKHAPVACVSEILKETQAEILINFLPTGSKIASEFYADQALKSGCGFINGIPECIASSKKWQRKFSRKGLPLVGDDVKSQLGGTSLHRDLVELFLKWGCKINNTYQLNFGGNTDFLNLIDPSRSETKIFCKNESIKQLIPYPTIIDVSVMTKKKMRSTSLEDPKHTKIHIDGENFGSRPLSIDVELHVEDSPNSAGVMIDIIRSMKVAIDKEDYGVINPICSQYFKNPPKPSDNRHAQDEFDAYIQ